MDTNNPPANSNTRREFIATGIAAGSALLASNEAAAQAPAGGRVTAHVLDLYTGTPANGLKLDFYAYNGITPTLLKSVVTNADGRPPEGPLMVTADMKTGRYQVVVHVGDYYKKIAAKIPAGYHAKLSVEFDIYDASQPYHVPFQITPWTQSSSVLPG